MKIAESLGIDVYISEPFSRELSQLTPQDFFLRLVKAMDVKNIFVGHDFNFGKNRSGTLSELQTLCDENKIKLEILSPVKIDGEVVSSTLIRNFVSQGQIDKANLFLGRPFSIKGVIERGIGRGNKIGFPTANLFTTDNLLLATGVYVTLFGIAGQIYPSVTNVGYNPTFAEKHETPRIETHIFDFSENIYGKQAKVSFLSRLRGEIKFDSAQKLIEQINADVIKARSYRWPKN
jgi:riboflavin kinase/FMN adenylyltransferase